MKSGSAAPALKLSSKLKVRHFYLALILFYPLSLLAQRGPGGVTNDSDNQKNCRLWLDASDLKNLADGDPVNVWYDKSVSMVNDSAFWDSDDASLYLQPSFRDAASAGINGKPVISFENGGMLSIGSWNGSNSVPPSVDLNSNPGVLTTYEQTLFLAFRTSNNVSDRQIIWEEGGSDRGFLIFINAGYVHIGAYDDRVDNDPGAGNVPAFGFTYKRLDVQPNTTYVLSFVYNVPTGAHSNALITNTFNPSPATYSGLTGTLNGQPFPSTMITGCCRASGVGGVFTHPDPIGIGGLNRTSYDETGDINGDQTGTRLFTGRLAEICYYAYALNTAERVIIENYLAAKYFSNVIANDKYVYEADYGNGVIGIGREQSGIDHNTSQGDNLFEISVANLTTSFPNAPQYLLVGHNDNSIIWTNQNTPDSASIKRLRRIWRWDRSGAIPPNKTVKIKLHPEDIAKLPALPTGHSKYGVLIESTSPNLPNFSQTNSQVIELVNNGSGTYTADISIEDGAFFTLCAIKPIAQFELFSDYAIESDPLPNTSPKFAKVILNYKPASSQTYSVGFNFVDGTAVNGVEYNPPGSSTANFPPGGTITYIPFNIVNDNVVGSPPAKDFNIILNQSTSSPGLFIGEKDTLLYNIFDDDPTPKISFTTSSSTVQEDDGIIEVQVQVLGTTTGSSNMYVVRPNVGVSGTATYDTDYTLPAANGWANYGSTRRAQVTVPAGTNQTASAYFSVNPDDLDEYNETIVFNLVPRNGAAGTGAGSILQHTLTIVDQDPEPTASFSSSASEGFESITAPRIYVTLSAPSAKEVSIPYQRGVGTATPDPLSNSDYSGPPSGFLIFAAGEIEKFIPLTVYGNDATSEPDETVVYDLQSNPVNAGLGSITNHIYTIKEYTEFEWQGVAGIGKTNDNTFWMVPDAASPGAGISSVPNLSPRPVQILQDVASKRPSVTTEASGLNNHKLIDFNGTSHNLKVGGSGSLEGQFTQINTGGLFDNKSIFFVFSPDKVNSTTPQVIYEQGGGTRGMSIYILQNKLYFYVWNGNNDGEFSPWGFTGNSTNTNSTGVAYIQSSIDLSVGQFYVVSCHYSRKAGFTSGNEPPFAGLRMYINGVLQDTYTGNVGRLYTHSGRTSIGSAWHQTKIHDRASTGPGGTEQMDWFFDGQLGEFIYLNEPRMNEARVRILHNYLSSLYNLPLSGGSQDFDLTFANNTNSANPDFNFQVAGIGKVGEEIHGDSQGASELRVTNPNFSTNTAFLNWGNNDETLTKTWPYSNTYLPATIMERSGKIWQFYSNPADGITHADLLIRFSAAENAEAFSADPSLLKLLINSTSDPENFSTAAVQDVNAILSGNVARFNNVPITNGMYVSLANTSAIYPLPIELLSFNARLEVDHVNLSWSTASEFNNDYFTVERADQSLNWEEVITTLGAGNSNTLMQYFEQDLKPLDGLSYYRLKQVDFDGTYEYSEVVSVMNAQTSFSDDVFLYPNPSTLKSVFMRIPHGYSQLETEVTFYNLSGVLVWQEQLGKDGTIFELKYGDLPAGVYIVQINSEVLNESKKLVIQ